jgi:hypothetical protein
LRLAFPRDRRTLIAATLAFCALVWIWRRPEQLDHPYVWDEERVILRNYLDHGWAAVFKPLQGYVVLSSAFFTTLSAQLSFFHLPRLEYGFALLLFLATFAMLLLPESRWGDLRMRCAMAVTGVLVPVNPETFGVLLYSFWWTTLWPLIVFGWRRTLWLVRAPALAVAALSSPAGGVLFVLFGIEFVRTRRLRDAISALILLAGFVVQSVLVLTSPRPHPKLLDVFEQTLRVGGLFTSGWLGREDHGFLAFAGLAFLVFLFVASIHVARTTRRIEPLILTLVALVYALVSSVNSPLFTDPVLAGPRYFFLPFFLFSWVLLQFIPEVGALRIAAAVLLAFGAFLLPDTFSRTPNTTTAELSWGAQLQLCAASHQKTVQLPIYIDGSNQFWTLDVTRADCRRWTD